LVTFLNKSCYYNPYPLGAHKIVITGHTRPSCGIVIYAVAYRTGSDTLFGKKSTEERVRILFLDRKNDYVSQLAEYFANQFYEGIYEVYSAGFEHDIIDCDLISVMYQNGEDMRRQVAKDLKNEELLPKDLVFDYVVYMEQPIFDEYSKKSPWQGKQILAPMIAREDFTATDDAELYDDYVRVIEQVKAWVKENLKDPKNLAALVSA